MITIGKIECKCYNYSVHYGSSMNHCIYNIIYYTTVGVQSAVLRRTTVHGAVN